jgi:hypothetical protein
VTMNYSQPLSAQELSQLQLGPIFRWNKGRKKERSQASSGGRTLRTGRSPWLALISYTTSAGISMAIWLGAFRVACHFIK